MKCHGCEGKGWIELKNKAVVCPICNGTTKPLKRFTNKEPNKSKLKYDQDVIWTELRENIPNKVEERLAMECADLREKAKGHGTVSVIVHLLFDRNVTPMGNVILHHLRRETISDQPDRKLSEDELKAKGYFLDNDGKIETINGIPIGKGYWILKKWGKAWSEPHGKLRNKETWIFDVELDPNRKGNPLFIDDNMAAFKITTDIPNDIDIAIHSLMQLTSRKINARIINIKLYLLA